MKPFSHKKSARVFPLVFTALCGLFAGISSLTMAANQTVYPSSGKRPANALNTGVDQDKAHQAVLDGEIIPLHDILSHVYTDYQGRILEVSLKDYEDGLHGWVYDIRLLMPDLRVLFLRIDASTGSILMVEGNRPTSPQESGP